MGRLGQPGCPVERRGVESGRGGICRGPRCGVGGAPWFGADLTPLRVERPGDDEEREADSAENRAAPRRHEHVIGVEQQPATRRLESP